MARESAPPLVWPRARPDWPRGRGPAWRSRTGRRTGPAGQGEGAWSGFAFVLETFEVSIRCREASVSWSAVHAAHRPARFLGHRHLARDHHLDLFRVGGAGEGLLQGDETARLQAVEGLV